MGGFTDSLSDNLFRREVDNDDIIFDIKPIERSATPGQIVEGKGVSGQAPAFSIGLPEIRGTQLGQGQGSEREQEQRQQQGGGSNTLPSLNLALPEIPGADLSTGSPDFSAAIDAVNAALPDVNAGVDLGAADTFLGSLGDGLNIGQALDGSPLDISLPLNAALGPIESALGDVRSQSAIRKGAGGGFGEVKLGGTGAVLDISKDLQSTIRDISKGTAFENIDANQVFNIARDPNKFIQDFGSKQSADFLANLGLDKTIAGDTIAAITDPDNFIKNKGTEAATNLIQKSSGVQVGGALTAGIGELIQGGDIKDVGEAVVKSAATETTLNVVSGAANAIIPGAGLVIQGIARLFNYSCYLSTSAYHYGLITKKDYFAFTHYRLKIQKYEPLAEQVWLGYIGLFSGIYPGLIDDEKKAILMYNRVTKWWLVHIKYLQGKGAFSTRGWLTTQAIRCACLGYYVLNYKSSRKLKKDLAGVNVLGTYKKLVNIIERNHAYG